MTGFSASGSVAAVCKKAEPGIPKIEVDAIQLIEDFGVEGDYHAGKYVRHRYLARKDPTQSNLRQVLLIDTTILAYLAGRNIHLKPGWMGENIILEGIEVMMLPLGTRLEIGDVLLEITEIRNPCSQLDEMHPGVLKAVESSGPAPDGRNAGMMARIIRGGIVKRGEPVIVRI